MEDLVVRLLSLRVLTIKIMPGIKVLSIKILSMFIILAKPVNQNSGPHLIVIRISFVIV